MKRSLLGRRAAQPAHEMARGGARNGHAPYCKWTVEEVELIYQCLADADFMQVHQTFATGQFPTERSNAATVDGGEYHRLCVSIAHRIMEEDGRQNPCRSALAIATKIQSMREHALATSADAEPPEAELFVDFDIGDFHADPKTLARRHTSAMDEKVPLEIDYVAPVRDATQISFQTHILNAHLACSLCKGYLNEACTIIECLHTFCKACIKAHFQTSQSCPYPKCGQALGTNPTDCVRNDRTLQSIVDKVFPRRQLAPVAAAEAGAGADALGPAARLDDEAEHALVSFSLQQQLDSALPLPLDRPFLRTDGQLTIAHLRKYVLGKAEQQLDGEQVFQILCHEQVLKPEWTLAHAYREYWNNPLRDMVLTFRVVSREPKATAQPDGAALAALGGDGGEEDDANEAEDPMDESDE